jgi:dipeptide/tripeptide permease
LAFESILGGNFINGFRTKNRTLKPSDQQHYVTPYFSVYFFIYNIGSTLGIFITPMLRNDVKCFNKDCWPAAIGLSTVLIILSFFAFLIGKRAYTTEVCFAACARNSSIFVMPIKSDTGWTMRRKSTTQVL